MTKELNRIVQGGFKVVSVDQYIEGEARVELELAPNGNDRAARSVVFMTDDDRTIWMLLHGDRPFNPGPRWYA